jgi:inosine-uridine nucleoside N-ribohydrolase
MLPEATHKTRVIINTDAKNEADDQYAIVHAILTPSFDLHGLISAHFGTAKSATSQNDSHEEILWLLDLMSLKGKVPVCSGASRALPDAETPVPSEGSQLIISEAMKDDSRPLHVAFLGPLTDMASALLEEPAIAQRNVIVVWIGGADWPMGGPEYNLSNDIIAANLVFRSNVQLWQIPSPVYKKMAVSYAELYAKVYDKGPIGKYLVEQLIEWNRRSEPGPMEYRSLGDSPAVGVMMYPDCGAYEWRPAPEFNSEMNYVHSGATRPIRVYQSVDQRYIYEDFFAKLAGFASSKESSGVTE